MEMQQIRYFLALARTLNFTRAAEECHVSQSALTRAIKALEGELGGELIRREHSGSHLTELGKRMAPLMQRCYDNAVTAKALAQSMTRDALAPVSLAIAHSVNAELAMGAVAQLFQAFPGMQLKLLRGDGAAILEALKQGRADIALAGPLQDQWERLDQWLLFEDRFELAVGEDHPLANASSVSSAELEGKPIACLAGCEMYDAIVQALFGREPQLLHAHETETQQDLNGLVERGVGMAIVAQSSPVTARVRRIPIEGLNVTRKVNVYAVSGRRREPVANTLLNLLRSTLTPAAAVRSA